MNINQRVIAITGGARGIGFEIAQELKAKNARIALLDLNQEALEEAVAALSGGDGSVKAYICNVADEAQVVAAFSAIVEDFGAIHGLINNAGIIRDAQLLKVKEGRVINKMSAENYSLVVDVHMKGAFLCAREAAAHMVEGNVEDGCIVNMSSIAAAGNFGQTNYSAAKAGMAAQSRVWAKELGRYGIRSMTVAPGIIETDMLRSMPPQRRQDLADGVPLQRVGQVTHIAQTVIHILENDYLTGTVIEVSGGLKM
jgi:3-oxoacyl-[acyl-carrier protein] reductase